MLAIILFSPHHVLKRNKKYVFKKGRTIQNSTYLLVYVFLDLNIVDFFCKTFEKLRSFYALMSGY